jgi:ATP-dependent DNA ligase
MNVFLKPMLAESIDPSKLIDFCNDDAWYAEQKVDGHRLLVVIEDGRVAFLNRAGEPKVSGVTPGMQRQFERLEGGPWVFDGEIVDSRLWLFDLPMAPGEVTPAHPYEWRRGVLDSFFGLWQPGDIVRLLPCRRETADKLELAKALVTAGAEGLMFKHRDAPYHSGKRTKQVLKAKFTKEADVVVTAISPDGKDSLAVGLHDPNGRLVDVGKSSTIGKGTFAVGDVITVRYLYVVPGGKARLYQPTILTKRDDKKAEECTMDQLQYTDKSVIEA